jgi:NADPH2:quinone reductase
MSRVPAWVLPALNGPGALIAGHIAVPPPGPAQVAIAVEAVGLGHVDWLIAHGGYQQVPPLPHVPGTEVAGRIVAVGSDVTGLAPGDAVVALTAHAMAANTLAPAAMVARRPADADPALVAALPLNGITVLHGLIDRGQMRAGETLLVLGAGGGVGLMAVAVGAALGAQVIAAASTPAKRAAALAMGAQTAIDSDADGWRERLRAALAGRPLDIVFDPVCGPLFEPAFRSLGLGGRHLVVGFVGGPIPALKASLTLMKSAALVGVDARQFMASAAAAAGAHLQRLMAMAGAGRFAALPLRRHADAAAALADAGAVSGPAQQPGKTVWQPGDRWHES